MRNSLPLMTVIWALSTIAMKGQVPITNSAVVAFTERQREKLTARALDNSRVKALAQRERVRPVRLAVAETEKDGSPTGSARIAELTLVRYSDNKGIRVRMNAQTEEVLDVQVMKGYPQSSEEEQSEAETLLREHQDVGPLLTKGARLVGGFVVRAPEGAGQTGRYLEYHVASTDGTRLLRKAFVDLTSGQVIVKGQD